MQTSSTCPAAQALWNLEAVRFIIILNYQSLALLFEIGVLTTVKVLKIMPTCRVLVVLSSTLSEMNRMISKEGWIGTGWRRRLLDSFLQNY